MNKLFIIIIVTFLVYNQTQGQVLISEFLAINSSVNISNESKNHNDWIELYNNNNYFVNVGGWYLTDNTKEPIKWRFPDNTVLRPKSHLVIWADDKNNGLHTNFKLNNDIEEIALYNKKGELVDYVGFTTQKPDVSYGRKDDTTSVWQYFGNPTPAKANGNEGVDKIKYAPEVCFSKSGGMYSDPLKLKLSTPSGKIYYTTDGSIPDENSLQYKNEINIEKTIVVRARVFSDAVLPGEVCTQTFIVKSGYTLPVISLSTNAENLWDNKTGIYTNGDKYVFGQWETANFFQNWERPANIEYYEATGQQGFNQQVGIKIFGNSTRIFSQKSFTIKASSKYGKKYIEYPLFKNKKASKYKSFLLRNSGNDWGNTMFLDAMAQSLIKDRMDVDIQAYQPAIVLINGKYWGIYNLREKMNASYIAANHNIPSNEIDLLKSNPFKGGFEIVKGDDKSYKQLVDFLNTNDMTKNENYMVVKEMIDVDEFINYQIAQIYFSNNDWPGNNLKIWRKKGDTGKWRWLLYDTDLSFSLSPDAYRVNLLKFALSSDSETRMNMPYCTLFFRKLMENNAFKEEFIQRFAAHLNSTFEPQRVVAVIDSIQEIIRPEIPGFIERWGGILQQAYPNVYTISSIPVWEVNVEMLRKFANVRPDYVFKHLSEEFNNLDTVNIKIKIAKRGKGKIYINDVLMSSDSFDGKFFAGIPVRIKAVPEKGYRFESWDKKNSKQEFTIIPEKDLRFRAYFQTEEISQSNKYKKTKRSNNLAEK